MNGKGLTVIRRGLSILFLAGIVVGLTADRFTNSARLYMMHNKWDQALDILLEGTEVNPDNPELYFLLGEVYAHGREYTKADSAYQKAVAMAPDEYAEEVAKRREALWAPLVNEAIRHLRREDYDAAIKTLELATMIRPEAPEAYINLGVAYSNKGEPEKAIEAYRKALELQPGQKDAMLNLASVLTTQERYGEAGEIYAEYLEGNPDAMEVRQNLAAIFLRAALELDVQASSAAEGKKQELTQKAVEYRQRAHQVYRDLLDSEQTVDAATYFNAGLALYQAGEYVEAARAFNKVIELNPEDTEAYELVGAAYLMAEDFEQATAALEKLVELIPNDADAWNNLGIAYSQLGRKEKALQAYTKAEELEKKTSGSTP